MSVGSTGGVAALAPPTVPSVAIAPITPAIFLSIAATSSGKRARQRFPDRKVPTGIWFGALRSPRLSVRPVAVVGAAVAGEPARELGVRVLPAHFSNRFGIRRVDGELELHVVG